MSEKRPKKAPKSPKICGMCTNTPKPRTGRILGYVAQDGIWRAPSPPATPHFLWFLSLRIAQRDTQTPVPLVTWCSRRAGQPTHSWGPTRVHQGPQEEKIIFSKVFPRPLGMLKQVFLGRLEPLVPHFGRWKIPKCLENGPFWDQQWIKNGAKTRFSKNDPGPFMMLKQVVLAHFEPVATRFGSWNIPKNLEMGLFWDQKMGQKWVKTAFFQK